MIKQIFFYGAISCLWMIQVIAEGSMHSKECFIETDPFRIGLRHIEAKGIGYQQGYTTLETFFASTEAWGDTWMPFLDVRGHVFNNATTAVNAGVGIRYLDSRVWGISGYYDYRRTHVRHYHQMSLGLESLGQVWDFRFNGYLPFGKTKESFSHSASERKREYALKSANLETGIHIDRFKQVFLYVAGGPYCLVRGRKGTWGGELRASIDVLKYVRLQAITSYDPLFKWIAQGEIGLFISLGGRRKIQLKKDRSCGVEQLLRRRAWTPVDRNEIIPVDHRHG